MSLTGTLEAFYLANLLQLLSQEKKTGVLEVRDGENKVKIFVKDGAVVQASSSQKGFRLGHLLKIKGILPEEQIHECLELGKKNKQKLGKILLEKGLVSDQQLKEVLQYQVMEILSSLFLWTTGAFEYKDVPFSVEGELLPQINTMTLVLEASRRIDEWSVIRKQIPNDKLIFKLSGETPGKKEIRFNNEEWRILSLTDGNRTVREVADESGLGDFTAHQIVHSLILSGLIERSEASYGKAKDIVDYSGVITIYNDILQVIRKNLAAELGERLFTMFEESSAELPSKQRRLFKDYDLRKPVDTNMQAMLEVMNTFQNYEEGRVFLRRSFNSLLLNLLYKEAELVGLPITERTVREAERTLSFVNKYQKDSIEKQKILGEIVHIMARVSQRIEDKK